MSGARPAAHPGGFRRRARIVLWVGGGTFVALAAGALLLRGRPAPYTPGTEAAASDEITRTLSRSLPAGVPRITFTDVAEKAGIHFQHFHGRRSGQLPEDMGSGAAWGDYDGDGDPDLYLVNESGPLTDDPGAVAASPARSALYRNEGDGNFTDVTEAAGVGVRGCGMGAAWGDYDGDGRLDLLVTRFGTLVLFRNRGDGTFEDVSQATGVGKEEGFWTGASWADYDRDGDLDLYVCGYVRYRYDATLSGKTSLQYRAVVPFTLNPSTFPPERNLLFRNEGGRFREVGRLAGVDDPTGRSLSAAWADFDGDGWSDLYVANDISDNAMFRNRGDGTFQDVSHSAWVADYSGAMGLAIGDWENDGDLDIFITHWIAQENALYENQKGKVAATAAEPMHFIDQADMLGLGQVALDFIGWGTGFIDYDNDGRLDLFVVNGSTFQRDDDPSRLVPMRNQLFWNAGLQSGFFEVGEVSGASFAQENVGRGAAFADYDGDGDVDVALVVNGGTARLLRNESGSARGWLRLVLRGPGGDRLRSATMARRSTTTFANGAVVRLTAGGLVQMREIGAGPSYLSQSPPGETLFGLGEARTIDRLEIVWPSGARQSFNDLPTRATISLIEGQEPSIRMAPAPGQANQAPAKATEIRFWSAFNEATSLRHRGQHAAAIEAYDRALALRPGHEDSLYYLGQSLLEVGRRDEALRAFTRLVETNPESARAHLALGALLASPVGALPPDLEGAEAHLRRAHAINGEETGPMLRLGEVLIVRGDLEQARQWLEAAARTNPKSVEAAFLSGYLLWAKGDRSGARAYCERAQRAARSDAPVQGVLSEGDRKTAQGKPAGATVAGPPVAEARVVAPPLEAPMGKTLFGAFSAPLRAGRPGAPVVDADPDLLYPSLREFVRTLRRRGTSR
ncbi:MAG TPA: FG-GAP-like repeat-containing protein [Candidatus Polarisedimenticolia bacterium]|nr:FG-GAP-like repeat-containing protein [Candidatus Polarisedimenticolia bacterium]